jgi:hypothetical protein
MRQEELIKAAAEAFGDGRDPFAHEWLVEHKVTADECLDLSLMIGTILHGYLASPKPVKRSLALRGAATAAGMPSDIVESAVSGLELRALTERLKKS